MDLVKRLKEKGVLMFWNCRLKVFNMVDAADAIKAETLTLQALWDAKASGEVLGQSDLPSTFAEKYHQPAAGIKRTNLNLLLKNMVLEEGIEVREGWGLVNIQEHEDSVTATFSNGESVTGSFLVGCDGIKSATRAFLHRQRGVEEGAPLFTGLVQVCLLDTNPSLSSEEHN
jgi:salicylate hydroxylase